jgi:hypothetical protein
VQHGPTAAVDGARILAVQGHDVATPAVRIFKVQVRQRLPAATETDDLDSVFAAAVGDGLMTELRPGTSPPPVRMPIRFFTIAPLNLDFRGLAAIRKVLCFTQHLPSSEARLPICTILMPFSARPVEAICRIFAFRNCPQAHERRSRMYDDA